MSMYGVFICVLAAMVVAGCNTPSSNSPQSSAAEGPFAVSWEVLDNLQEGGLRSELILTNNGSTALGNSGWTLYFNFVRLIDAASLPSSIQATHISGDFFKFEPTSDFTPLQPGESLSLPFTAAAWTIKKSDAPSGFYFVFTDEAGQEMPPQVISDVTIKPFVTDRQTKRNPNDNLAIPTAASRYEANEALTLLPPDQVGQIVPTPVHIENGEGQVTLDASWQIHYASGLESEAAYLSTALESVLGASIATSEGTTAAANTIVLTIGTVSVNGTPKEAGDEAYRLAIDPQGGIQITGSDAAGVFYGIQSLRGLLPVAAYQAPQASLALDATTVEDAPGFGYRGMNLDVARNFQTKETIKKLFDLMAFYKMNKFHFGVTNDEGWRLEIAGLPELTAVGSRRGHTLDELDRLHPSYGSGPDPDPSASYGSGYYTREDFIELLRYAKERHIEVIPEINMPGHARAAIKAMESRHARLMADGREDEQEANAHRIYHPDDVSEYSSVQNFSDNVIDVCLPSTYTFIETVIDDLVVMFAEADAPLTTVHTGGDEVPNGVWEKSPACEALLANNTVASTDDLFTYYLEQVSSILSERGLDMAGWEEIALAEARHGTQASKEPNPAFIDRNISAYVWNNVWGWGAEDLVYKLANAGYKVVMCNATNLYFDMAYDKDPEEPGFYWASFVDTRTTYDFVPFDLFKSARIDQNGNPIDQSIYADRIRPTEAGRRNMTGIQGLLWSETVKGPESMEYMAFPKLLSLAERAWSPEPAWATIENADERTRQQDAAWNEFANRLGQRELLRLDHLLGGTHYRLPLPGAVVEDGMLKANVAFPGLTLRYTTDGSEPTPESPAYIEPVVVDGTVTVKTFATGGRSSRASIVTN